MQDFGVGELHYEEIARGSCDDFRKESDEERASCPFRYNPSGGTSYESGKEERSYVEQEHPQGEADEAAGEAFNIAYGGREFLIDIYYGLAKALGVNIEPNFGPDRKGDIKHLEDAELVIYLKEKLNRPMRVCGVVKNVGEPGGGPFLTYNSDGTVSLQILESSQIDKSNKEYMEMFANGTHFNPVDLVCAVKDYKGRPFNLPDYVDKSTGFISSKSKNGKELKALELPGLWNGAMSNWNTVFVEVPLSTFNPVKTVNDLLREQHQ